ncbi:HNH endonuclease [Rhodococcus sp. 4CII]|uniref:HNH endonuclease n=1 Tax=Rhodococcus sp. 4CII TaxID=2834580 RepID=UPI00163DD91C|nr:HNH endonuclease [Rhodococcus sp. 4CII]MBC2898416.1 HNH endonuclease [Rhodococcus sp. 4CII]
MNWWDVEFGEIRMMSAEETAAFLAEVKRDNRTQRRQQRFPDHRLRRASFIQPVDVDGNAITERFTSMDIYARDGGICQLCLEPVDFDALYGPEALSIDHIDREGPHTRANCRLTHLFCNNDAQWASGFDPELARARLHHKVITNEKVDPADHFPRRSPFTGHVVSYEERRQQEFAAADMAQRIDTPPPPRTATERLVAAIRSLFRRG